MNRESPVDRRELALIRKLKAGFREIDSETDMDALEEAVRDGDISRVEDEAGVGTDEWALAILVAILLAHLREVMVDLSKTLSEQYGLPFDPIDDRIQSWLRSKSSEFRRDLAAQSREVIEALMIEGLQRDRDPKETAALILLYRWVLIRQLPGLEKLRQRMLNGRMSRAAIRAALAGAVGSAKTNRAELFAATAITAAITAVIIAIIADAVLAGTAPRNVRWVTQRDELVCPVCGALDGVVQPLGAPWGLLGLPGPPAHPRCRCHLESA